MPDTVVRFEHVSLQLDETLALDDVSFELVEGETKIIVGAAGSGKSVLLKAALGLLRPDSGRIYLFGQDVTDLKEQDLFAVRARIGVLFQEGGLFDSLTVRENVEYPLLYQRGRSDEHRRNGDVPQRVKEALTFVELGETLEKFPSELSGGMRRRVGIARATVTQPELVLYDSPTAGLDPITANNIVTLIIKARDTAKTTTMIVTHRYQDGHLMANFSYNPQSGELEPASQAKTGIHDRTGFLVFREGKLVFQGTQEDLEAATDPYIAKFRSVKTE